MMKRTFALISLGALLCLLPQAALAQRSKGGATSVKQELEALREGQRAMQKELEEIKALLRARQGGAAAASPALPKDASVSIAGYPFKGDPSARLVLVEFSDYQCPFCGRHQRETLPQIERDYIKTGKLRYVFKDMPLISIHPQAVKAAEATICAEEQGKYWEMHAQLFKNQRALAPAELSLHAQAVGADVLPFQQCLYSGKHEARVMRSVEEASGLGISGTPSMVLALAKPGDAKLKVLSVISGARPYSDFKAAIDAALDANR